MIDKFIATINTIKHKFWVMWYILKICWSLFKRGIAHDMSKFSKEEFGEFIKYTKFMKHTKYGSDEYYNYLEKLKPALSHHYSRNSHHPEYHTKFIRMTSLDLLEMLADWGASVHRHKTSDLQNSFEINQKRFKYNNKQKERLIKDAKEAKIL